MDSRMDKIQKSIEDYAGDSWTDGYHMGYDEAWDEARNKGFDEGFEVATAQAVQTIWVDFTGRHSNMYRFSTSDRNHPMIAILKKNLKSVNEYNARISKMYPKFAWRHPKQAIELRPRGPGHTFSNWIGLDNAEYFDVYQRNVFP